MTIRPIKTLCNMPALNIHIFFFVAVIYIAYPKIYSNPSLLINSCIYAYTYSVRVSVQCTVRIYFVCMQIFEIFFFTLRGFGGFRYVRGYGYSIIN